MICTCGFDNASGSRFCGKCGLALGGETGDFVPHAPASAAVMPKPRAGKHRSSGRWLTIVASVAVVAAAGYWWLSGPGEGYKPWRSGATRGSTSAHDGLYRIINVESKFGFVGRSGKIVINPQFDEAGEFSDGLAMVQMVGKYGFIDKAGAVVINPQFDAAGGFSDGLAPVALNNRWGYVDRRGAYVTNPQFDRAYEFSNGLAVVMTGGKAGYVNPKGQIVINPQFDVATKFSEGLAAVCVGQRWGYIDTTGKITINPQFDDPGVFVDGLAAVSLQGRFGYIGTDGTYVINPQFESALEFSEAAAAVKAGEKWGYIARDGKYIVSPQFDDAWPFADGRGLVRLGDNYGYIDVAGKFVINPQYVVASSFVNGWAAVGERSGEVGFIDRTGKYVWASSVVIEKTMADMRSMATAWEARATDTGSYQIDGISDGVVSSDQLSSVLTPTYLRQVPQSDGWQKPFLLQVFQGGQSYSIRSAGPNQTGTEAGTPDADDLVYSNGRFSQAPVSGRPLMSGYPFLRELVLSELAGVWRDERGNCLDIEHFGARNVSVGVRRCQDGDGSASSIGIDLIGRSLYWRGDHRLQLALLWGGALEGTLEAVAHRERLGTRGPLRFTKVREQRRSR